MLQNIGSIPHVVQYILKPIFSSIQSLSCVRFFVTSWTAACQAFLSITNSWSLLKLMAVASVMPSNHLIFCCPLLLPPSIFPSIRVFSSESVLHNWWLNYSAVFTKHHQVPQISLLTFFFKTVHLSSLSSNLPFLREIDMLYSGNISE